MWVCVWRYVWTWVWVWVGVCGCVYYIDSRQCYAFCLRSFICGVKFFCIVSAIMVSNYKRKTNKGSYSKETLRAAVQAVKNGHVSGYKAAQIYNIPRMTIMDHVYNRRIKSTSLGRNTALTLEVEANLVSLLHLMEKMALD